MAKGRGSASADRLWAVLDAAAVLSSTLDLDRVLTRIVRIACRVVGTRYGALGVLDESGTGLSNFVYHGVSSAEAERIGPLPVGKGLLGAVITDPKPIRLADLRSDPRSVGFPAHHPPMRSFLGVPVISKDQVFGNLYLTEKRDGQPFTKEDEDIAVALARQAGVAVENARLYREAQAGEAAARSRVEILTSLQEVGTVLLGELEPARVFRTVATQARDLLHADTAALCMSGPARNEFRIETVVGRGARRVAGSSFPVRGSLSGRVLVTGEPACVEDTQADDRVHYPIADALEARSALFVPLADRGERVGVLAVTHRATGRFDADDLEVLRSFGSLASLAIQNARLFSAERDRADAEAELAATQVREEMKAELLRQVIRAQEDERRRVSRDLHDSAGQALASILLGLKVAEQERTLPEVRGRIGDLRRMASDAAGELRRLALELRPTVLDDLGLVAALERYVRDFQERTGIRTVLRIEGEERRLDPEAETVVYRVNQEALTNIAKYAGADAVRIRLSIEPGGAHLRVRDDGVGFDPEAVAHRGLGLRGMHERASLVGGTVKVRSAPGKGTTVELHIPADKVGAP